MGTNETVSPEALIARPSVGRIVHYHDGTTADPQPAIVSSLITTHTVALTVFAATRDPYRVGPVPVSETPKAGHWCWPPRV